MILFFYEHYKTSIFYKMGFQFLGELKLSLLYPFPFSYFLIFSICKRHWITETSINIWKFFLSFFIHCECFQCSDKLFTRIEEQLCYKWKCNRNLAFFNLFIKFFFSIYLLTIFFIENIVESIHNVFNKYQAEKKEKKKGKKVFFNKIHFIKMNV